MKPAGVLFALEVRTVHAIESKMPDEVLDLFDTEKTLMNFLAVHAKLTTYAIQTLASPVLNLFLAPLAPDFQK